MSLKGPSFVDRFSGTILLYLLSMEPLKGYHGRGIARMTGVSLGKANQVLKALEKEELVLK
jgi:DNA-binding MarR family transcriptional regulator